MAKKHKIPEHVNHERWLVSYADFITLLFAFFVVLFSSAQVDAESSATLSISMEQAFNQFSIFKYQSGSDDDQSSKGGKKGNAYSFNKFKSESERGVPMLLPREIMQMKDFDAVIDENGKDKNDDIQIQTDKGLATAQSGLMKMIEQEKIKGKAVLKHDRRGIVMSVRDGVLFEPGSADLSEESKAWLSEMRGVLGDYEGDLRVEGHTSTELPKPPFKNFWELSTARAVRVADWLINNAGVDKSKIIPIGYGAYRPQYDNQDPVDRLKNDRIDFVILKE